MGVKTYYNAGSHIYKFTIKPHFAQSTKIKPIRSDNLLTAVTSQQYPNSNFFFTEFAA